MSEHAAVVSRPTLKRKLSDLQRHSRRRLDENSFTKPPSVFESSRSRPSSPVNRYDEHASIILVGLKGAGKKTLAVIASICLGRKYINFEKFFEEQTSSRLAEHLRSSGLDVYRRTVFSVAEKLLSLYGSGHIIGGFEDVTGRGYKDFLYQARTTNPIIYVRRDKSELRRFTSSEEAKFQRWYQVRDMLHFSCASHTFYNLCDQGSGSAHVTLKLKNLETDFIALLDRIFERKLPVLLSDPPLSATYTYALHAPLTWLESLGDYECLDNGADAVSLHIDLSYQSEELHSRVAKQMAILRRYSRAAIIFEFGDHVGNEPAYYSMLKLAGQTLPDMVACDHETNMLALKRVLPINIKIICCLKSERPWVRHSHSDLPRTVKQCSALRITHEASAHDPDNFECLELGRTLSKHLGIPVTAYNTGEWGKSSICFNRVLSPVVPPGSAFQGLSIVEAQTALYSGFVLAKRQYAIFGKSVSYSLSPAMHNAAYREYGMPHDYKFHQSDSFLDIHKIISHPNCGGLAVSLPYKTSVLAILDHISPEAQAIGAVNTVVVQRKQSSIVLQGHNTDHIGVRQCIYHNLSPANSVRSTTCALIIGAGGMARAAMYACQTLGVKNFCIYNRTYQNALALANSTSSNVNVCESLKDEWPQDISQPTIVISTVPAHDIDGVAGFASDIPSTWLRSRTGGVFIELAYKPLVTGLLSQFHNLSHKGWIAVDGLEVLLEQGIAQFEILTGKPAPIHVMRRVMQQSRLEMGTRTNAVQ